MDKKDIMVELLLVVGILLTFSYIGIKNLTETINENANANYVEIEN